MIEKYRHLTDREIAILELGGCSASDWRDVTVKDPFNPHNYKLARFTGVSRLGTTDARVKARFGDSPTGIYNAHIHSCTIGDNVRIVSVHDSIANYDIDDNVIICNVDSLTCTGPSSFGNGVMVRVLDETGARAIPIHDRLSAQIAYLHVFYRHDERLVSCLDAMTADYVATLGSSRGRVGRGTIISDSATITNVRVGNDVIIVNAGALNNGTICNGSQVRNGVIATDFIFQTDTVVKNLVVAERVYVGQGSRLTDGFSVVDSLIFANCDFSRGEAVSVFAGPHTTSRHKSTLLISSYFLFFDAGSGTNQSNTHYRLGPIHYGLVQRGCKTGVNTCVTWPGCFAQHSIITGSHFKHPDIWQFPFSYINADERGNTILRPARVLGNVGLISDLCRWPEEDRRDAAGERLDCINYDFFSPYYIGSLFNGLNQLVKYKSDPDSFARCHFTISNDDINEGRKIYAFFIDYLMGQKIVRQFLDADIDPDMPFGPQLFNTPDGIEEMSVWIDVAGLIAPRCYLDSRVVRHIATGEIADIDSLNNAFHNLHADYVHYQTAFLRSRFDECFSVDADALEPAMFRAVIDRWSESLAYLTSSRRSDCLKEFSGDFRIVFGIDGDAQADFNAVRGTPDTNVAVSVINGHYAERQSYYVVAVEKLKTLYPEI